jgi:ParB family chromosome partitioning protein
MASGKAIDAPRGASTFKLDPDEVIIVGLDTDDGPEHPRYDERIHLPLKEETVLNFMSIGVHTPIVVCKAEHGVEVDDGRRRVMHAREANKRLRAMGEEPLVLLALPKRGDDAFHQTLGVVLNEHREDDGILGKITKAKRLYDRLGGDQDALHKVADAFGVSSNAVKGWLKIDELPAAVKNAVKSGVLSAHAASQLHGLDKAERDAKLEELKASHAATGKRATASQATKGTKNDKGPKRPSAKRLAVLSDTLTEYIDEEVESKEQGETYYDGILLGLKLALGDETAAAFLDELLSEGE